jgi:putrescine transport system substrate-binding protein
MDVAAIPKNAPNVDNAYRFLDFMMDPKVAAASSVLTNYANGNGAATPLLAKSISGNKSIYPTDGARANFYTITAGTPEQTRERTRLWTAIKTGQ